MTQSPEEAARPEAKQPKTAKAWRIHVSNGDVELAVWVGPFKRRAQAQARAIAMTRLAMTVRGMEPPDMVTKTVALDIDHLPESLDASWRIIGTDIARHRDDRLALNAAKATLRLTALSLGALDHGRLTIKIGPTSHLIGTPRTRASEMTAAIARLEGQRREVPLRPSLAAVAFALSLSTRQSPVTETVGFDVAASATLRAAQKDGLEYGRREDVDAIARFLTSMGLQEEADACRHDLSGPGAVKAESGYGR